MGLMTGRRCAQIETGLWELFPEMLQNDVIVGLSSPLIFVYITPVYKVTCFRDLPK